MALLKLCDSLSLHAGAELDNRMHDLSSPDHLRPKRDRDVLGSEEPLFQPKYAIRTSSFDRIAIHKFDKLNDKESAPIKGELTVCVP